jgi:TolA-binding protein
MNKIYFLLITGALLTNDSYGQSKADLIRSIEELKVANVQNQTKIESLQKDVENLKVRVTIGETKIQSQEKEISRLNQLLGSNGINQAPAGSVSNNVEPNNINRPSNSSVKSQCKGITKAGSQCKRSAGPNGYCYQHGG